MAASQMAITGTAEYQSKTNGIHSISVRCSKRMHKESKTIKSTPKHKSGAL